MSGAFLLLLESLASAPFKLTSIVTTLATAWQYNPVSITHLAVHIPALICYQQSASPHETVVGIPCYPYPSNLYSHTQPAQKHGIFASPTSVPSFPSPLRIPEKTQYWNKAIPSLHPRDIKPNRASSAVPPAMEVLGEATWASVLNYIASRVKHHLLHSQYPRDPNDQEKAYWEARIRETMQPLYRMTHAAAFSYMYNKLLQAELGMIVAEYDGKDEATLFNCETTRRMMSLICVAVSDKPVGPMEPLEPIEEFEPTGPLSCGCPGRASEHYIRLSNAESC